jgi:integrase
MPVWDKHFWGRRSRPLGKGGRVRRTKSSPPFDAAECDARHKNAAPVVYARVSKLSEKGFMFEQSASWEGQIHGQSNLRTREYLTEHEVERLVEAAKHNRHGHRDAIMVLVAYRHGLRAAELVDLRWDQVDFKTATLHVRRVKAGASRRLGKRTSGKIGQADLGSISRFAPRKRTHALEEDPSGRTQNKSAQDVIRCRGRGGPASCCRQTRAFRNIPSMSALPPKTDIPQRRLDVR